MGQHKFHRRRTCLKCKQVLRMTAGQFKNHECLEAPRKLAAAEHSESDRVDGTTQVPEPSQSVHVTPTAPRCETIAV